MWSDIAMNDSAEVTRESALVDDLAERIRQRITAGEFPIGMQLRQAALANEFKVSRTPVREALRKLQAGGLITVTPHRGAVVRVPAPWEVRDAYEVRAELEGLAAERAATRIGSSDIATLERANDTMRKGAQRAPKPTKQTGGKLQPTTAANDTFHMVILAAAGNERLAQVIQQIKESFSRKVRMCTASRVRPSCAPAPQTCSMSSVRVTTRPDDARRTPSSALSAADSVADLPGST